MDAGGNNRYELLFMDDDGESSAQVVVQKKSPANAPAIAPPKKPIAVKKPSNQAEKENKSGTLNKGPTGIKKGQLDESKSSAPINRNSRVTEQTGNRNVTFKPDNDRREQRNNRRNVTNSEFGTVGGNEDPNQRQQKQFRDRDNRPPRNRDGNYRSGKREFDRQSGSDKTGVKAVDKRDGAGAHNWGSVKQEIEDINIDTAGAGGDGILPDKDDSANEQAVEVVNLPEEEEVKEMTLDEWKAMRQQREKPKYNIRKPGEGEDPTQWKKMIVLNKKKEGDSEEELEYDPSLYPQRVGRLQRIVDIQFNFKDGRRGGGNFGGRGRAPRRFGGGEKPRFEGNDTDDAPNKVNKPRSFGDKPKSAVLKVDYESQFPTLS